jgi:DNA-binding PadR family transcriptional regulator
MVKGIYWGGDEMVLKTPSDLLRGHTDTIVLAILRKGDSYGYEIHKSIMEKTQNQFEMKEATLYSSYRRLEEGGYITSYWGDESQGGRRKYYKITEKGRELYRQNKEDWEFSQRILNKLLEEE